MVPREELLPPSIHSLQAPDGNLLAVADGTGHVVLWDRPHQEIRRIGSQHGFATTISFAPNSLRLAVGHMGGQLVLYDPHTCEQVGPVLDVNQPETITFSADGLLLAAATGNEVVLWDTATWQRVRAIRAGQAFVRRLAFHPGGQILATAGDTPTLALWDIKGRWRGRAEAIQFTQWREIGIDIVLVEKPDPETILLARHLDQTDFRPCLP